MSSDLRPQLGEFSSIVCFKAIVVGMEEALGATAAGVALKAAGRKRGAALAHSLGFGQRDLTLDEAQAALRGALGPQGTRLCLVDRLERDGDAVRVYLSETICSAGEPQGASRECTFTLGAVHGALEILFGAKLKGRQVGSVLRGASHDVLEFTPR